MLRFKKIVGDILGFVLLLIFKKAGLQKFDNHVLSIYFHNPSSLLFKGIIRFLRANDFHFISENEMHKIVIGEQNVDKRKVFISFDDAWKGNLKLIPIIEKYQIPISIFVPVKPIVSGNYWWEYVPYLINKFPEITCVEDLKQILNSKRMNYVQEASSEVVLKRSSINLKELQDLQKNPLISIGSHTYHHPISIRCTDEELAFEYSESKKILESWLNTEINSFAYPNGDYNGRDLELLKKNGYKIAFTTSPNLTQENRSVYEIPRVSINSNGGKYENIARMLGLWHQYVQSVQVKLNRDKKKGHIQIIDQYS